MARAKGIGVDGCPAGWVMATVMNGAAEPVEVYASISELYAAAKSKASVILLDMPIGLSEGGREGASAIDLAAKRWARDEVRFFQLPQDLSSPPRPMRKPALRIRS